MKRERLYFLIIIVLAFILRFAFLSKIPSELNRDEVSVGFNAYSLLKTGKDEHGRGPWPLVFRAFGDNKIPGYIYLTAPLIKIFGLNAFTVRLPAAFFGWLTIVVGYFFVKELFPKREKLALLFSFLLAVAPFHLHYSRQQFETTVALFFTLTGLLFFLKARRKINYLFLALPFFVISFFIYNTPLFIIPPLILFSFFIYREDYLKGFKKRLLVLSFAVLLTFGWFSYWRLATKGNQGRANTTIFTQEGLQQNINDNIYILNKKGIPLFLCRMFYNKPIYWIKSFLKNYSAAFNPDFIFFTSDNNSWHNLRNLGFGNLLPISIPFILISFWDFIKDWKQKSNGWLLGYLLISAGGNGLTIDSPILTRLLNFHLVLVLLTALGVNKFWIWKIKKLKWKNFLLSFLLVFSVTRYLLVYFLIYSQKLDYFWLSGIKEVCTFIKQEEENYDFIIFDQDVGLVYIFPAFYLPFDPAEFQVKADRILHGFDRAVAYDKYLFEESISDWQHPDMIKQKIIEKNIEPGKRILLIERLSIGSRVPKEADTFLIYNFWGETTWRLKRITT